MTEKNRNLLIPVFSDFHAPFMRASLKGAGCDSVSLASGAYGRTAALGLAHVNNDACFATIITAGRAIMAMGEEKSSVDGGSSRACAFSICSILTRTFTTTCALIFPSALHVGLSRVI